MVLRRLLEAALDAAVGMMDQSRRRPLPLDCHVERLQCDLGVEALAH